MRDVFKRCLLTAWHRVHFVRLISENRCVILCHARQKIKKKKKKPAKLKNNFLIHISLIQDASEASSFRKIVRDLFSAHLVFVLNLKRMSCVHDKRKRCQRNAWSHRGHSPCDFSIEASRKSFTEVHPSPLCAHRKVKVHRHGCILTSMNNWSVFWNISAFATDDTSNTFEISLLKQI